LIRRSFGNSHELLRQELSQGGPARLPFFPLDGRTGYLRIGHLRHRERAELIVFLRDASPKSREALAVADDTCLPDDELTPRKDMSALVKLELIHRVSAKAGFEIPLVGTDGAQPAHPAGEQRRAAQAELVERLAVNAQLDALRQDRRHDAV